MIKPQHRKVVCEKCNTSKILYPKSDCDVLGFTAFCPKCKQMMKKSDKLGFFDYLKMSLHYDSKRW